MKTIEKTKEELNGKMYDKIFRIDDGLSVTEEMMKMNDFVDLYIKNAVKIPHVERCVIFLFKDDKTFLVGGFLNHFALKDIAAHALENLGASEIKEVVLNVLNAKIDEDETEPSEL